MSFLPSLQCVPLLANRTQCCFLSSAPRLPSPKSLPADKAGADLLFQVLSKRYERASILLTTNQPYKRWPKIFNNDSTLTSAVLDRLLHHAETVIVEGKSYRMKDQIEKP